MRETVSIKFQVKNTAVNGAYGATLDVIKRALGYADAATLYDDGQYTQALAIFGYKEEAHNLAKLRREGRKSVQSFLVVAPNSAEAGNVIFIGILRVVTKAQSIPQKTHLSHQPSPERT